jgi:Fe-S cluster biogenesis protein NfuA
MLLGNWINLPKVILNSSEAKCFHRCTVLCNPNSELSNAECTVLSSSFKKDMMETEGLLLICFYLHQQVLDEIRPYLAGTGGGELEFVAIEEPVVKVRLTGPVAGVMTVRVALPQKLREKIPKIAAVQLLS